MTPLFSRRRLLRSVAATVIAAAEDIPASGDVEITAEPVAFDGDPGPSQIGRLTYRGGVVLSSYDQRFGGWSDLEISAVGDRLTMISDLGHFLDAPLSLDDAGGPRGVGPALIGKLIDPVGNPLLSRRASDAEGLARAPDGGFYVSFEGWHRIWHYPGGAGSFRLPPRIVPPPPGLAGAPGNGGLEAIAAWPDGGIVALAEEFRDGQGDHRGWIDGPQDWRDFTWAQSGFSPTGAAIAPDGTLLVLERRFAMLSFAARIVQVSRAACRAGGRVAGNELAAWGPPRLIDNFEGLTARRGRGGETLIYLVSDDNFFSPIQRTLLVCFEIRPG